VDLWGVESVSKMSSVCYEYEWHRALIMAVDSTRGKHERSLGAVNK
jgi:hypothetical protein